MNNTADNNNIEMELGRAFKRNRLKPLLEAVASIERQIEVQEAIAGEASDETMQEYATAITELNRVAGCNVATRLADRDLHFCDVDEFELMTLIEVQA